MLSGLDHLTLLVKDPVAATETYRSLLGVEPSWQGEHPELGTRASLFGMFNGVMELVGPAAHDERDEGLRAQLAQRGEGLHALAFATASAQECRAALRERGLRAAPPEQGEARGEDGQLRSYRSVELSPRSTLGLSILAVERADGAALRSPSQRPAHAVDAIDHVVIRSADPDRSIELFRDGLGIRLALDRVLAGTRMLFFRMGKVTLEVVQDPGAGEQDRLWGVAFRVRDIEGAHARMAGAGLEMTPIRDGRKAGTRVFSLRGDPCGVPTLVLRDPSRD